jgi:hypothetical protein
MVEFSKKARDISIMEEAVIELRMLRQRLEIAEAKCWGFESAVRLLYSTPTNAFGGGAMHPDPMVELQKLIQDMKSSG